MRIALSLAVLCGLSFAADTGIFKTAPPPPVSWERDRVADLTARRKAMMDRIGPKAVLVLFAAEARNYANDVDWPYRQENDFFYLTGLTQPGSTLVLIPGAEKMKEVLFTPAPVPSRETWTGHMYTSSEARDVSGVQNVFEAGQFNTLMTTLIPRSQGALMPGATGRGAAGPAGDGAAATPSDSAGAGRGGRGGRGGRSGSSANSPWGTEFEKITQLATAGDLQLYMILPARPNAVEYRREQEFAGKLAGVGAGIAIKDATTIFGELRRVKSQRELDILQHAVDITAEAFQRAYALAVPGTWEYEIQAQFEFTFLRRNAHWGYPCIVGSGTNATTLHYESNKSQMKDGDLLLMDDAAEFDQYSVDVTRTIPVNGKFNKEQADIYRLVYDAQQAGFKEAKPGKPSNAMQNAALEVFKRGLLKLGLITDPENATQVRVWSIHGMSHGIGLAVHDPGGRELQPGMVVTLEPGLYFRPDALDNLPKTPEMEKFAAAVRPAFEKYKGIGVRLEDDVLITNGEPMVMSSAIPSKLEDVEASITKLRAAKSGLQ
jgi:Xaa-Pro aminopeptidase